MAASFEPDAVGCSVAINENFDVLFSARCIGGHARDLLDPYTPYLLARLMASTLQNTLKPATIDTATDDSTTKVVVDDRALAGRVAHEFNNVLTSITGYAEMAADGLKPGSSSYRYVEHIQLIGQRARRIVDHMLDSSRPRQNREATFDVVAAVRDIIPDIRMVIPRSAKFTTLFPQHALHIRANITELEQALTNLCKNAGEAVRDTGTVSVQITTFNSQGWRQIRRGRIGPGKYALLSVKDTGSGIDNASMELIFDPFYTTRSRDGGTGLGLPMVCDFVDRVQGALDVQSEMNSGTTFEMYLPLAAELRTAPTSSTKQQALSAGGARASVVASY